ncbi:MAG: SRPBCC domain-containing protein [Bacillota bacterium]|nr:SRPBCC domain-containing protein [Bacillota bacterium]
MEFKKVQIGAKINENVQKVWDHYTEPRHVMQWNHASEDWHCPSAENDLREGGRFRYTMASRDGKVSFDFEGKYEKIEPFNRIVYILDDGRTVDVHFESQKEGTDVNIEFDAEGENSIDMQRQGWQAILNNFKKYVEA